MPSVLPTASLVPSGEKATDVTSPSLSTVIIGTSLPLTTSYTVAVEKCRQNFLASMLLNKM
jgi:hypothetical protein